LAFAIDILLSNGYTIAINSAEIGLGTTYEDLMLVHAFCSIAGDVRPAMSIMRLSFGAPRRRFVS
jgi:hypothetical protein